MFSDASGQFEAVIFSDTLAASRDLLEGGTPVVLNVEAERDGDTVKMRVQSMEALDKAAAEIERGLKIVFDSGVLAARRSVVEDFKALLKPGQAGGRRGGEVRVVLPVGARELELVLPGRYDVSPAQAGQLSTVPGWLRCSKSSLRRCRAGSSPCQPGHLPPYTAHLARGLRAGRIESPVWRSGGRYATRETGMPSSQRAAEDFKPEKDTR